MEIGVDLGEYGRQEKHIHSTRNVNKTWTGWWSSRKQNYWTEKIHLASFEYGPEPSDWKFWLIQELEPWFFEFWDMVDHPERAMPGAWNDLD